MIVMLHRRETVLAPHVMVQRRNFANLEWYIGVALVFYAARRR